MTRDEIISMFHEAGEAVGWKPGVGNKLVINYLTHFAALVASAEREQCAQVCELIDTPAFGTERPAPNDCAAAIRARGKA